MTEMVPEDVDGWTERRPVSTAWRNWNGTTEDRKEGGALVVSSSGFVGLIA